MRLKTITLELEKKGMEKLSMPIHAITWVEDAGCVYSKSVTGRKIWGTGSLSKLQEFTIDLGVVYTATLTFKSELTKTDYFQQRAIFDVEFAHKSGGLAVNDDISTDQYTFILYDSVQLKNV